MVSTLYFIQSGVLDVYTVFEKSDFIIDKLYSGSIINHRSFFNQEPGTVYIKVSEDSLIHYLPFEKMEILCRKHKSLDDKFIKLQTRIQS